MLTPGEYEDLEDEGDIFVPIVMSGSSDLLLLILECQNLVKYGYNMR